MRPAKEGAMSVRIRSFAIPHRRIIVKLKFRVMRWQNECSSPITIEHVSDECIGDNGDRA